jgi:hypothetical protein
MDEDDSEDWLTDSTWAWTKWKMIYEGWSHDHCLFCNAHVCGYESCTRCSHFCWIHFYADEVGYVPGNDSGYCVICDDCFQENRQRYGFIDKSESVSG